MPPGEIIHDRHRGLGQNADRRHHDLELVRAKFLEREERLVFPADEHIADFPLKERGARAPRAGVQHRHIAVKSRHKILRLRRVAAVVEHVAPRGQHVQRAAPEVFGLAVTIATPGFTRSFQSWMRFGFPFRTRNTMVEV